MFDYINNSIIFDIETVQNGCFCGFLDLKTEIYTNIDLTEKQELENFLLKNKSKILVGFNNFFFDNVMLQFCIEQKRTNEEILQYCADIFAKKEQVIYNIICKKNSFQTYDCYDNKGSLKLKAFTKYNEIYEDGLDSAYHELVAYNKKDLEITKNIFSEQVEDISLADDVYEHLTGKQGNFKPIRLTISNWLNNAFVNTYKFEDDLLKLKIDTDLLGHAISLYNTPNNAKKADINILTTDGYALGLGGIHYSHDENLVTLDTAHLLDVASYYPTMYTHLLSFFKQEKREILKEIIDLRLKYKASDDEEEQRKSKSLKLFINSLYGLASQRNKQAGKAVTILGQILMIQFLRDNNIQKSDVLELNTDGILLSVCADGLKKNLEYQGLSFEYEQVSNLVHRDVNNKMYTSGKKLKCVGNLFANIKRADNLNLFDVSPLFKGGKLYNNFYFTQKDQNGYAKNCYVKFKNINNIRELTLSNCVIANKKTLQELLEQGKLEPITVKNQEDITEIIRELWQKYLNTPPRKAGKKVSYLNVTTKQQELITIKNEEFKLENEYLNNFFHKYSDMFYMIASRQNKMSYKGDTHSIEDNDKKTHNLLKFKGKEKASCIGIIPGNELVVVDVDEPQNVSAEILQLLENQETFKVYNLDIKTNNKADERCKYIFKMPQNAAFKDFGKAIEFIFGNKKVCVYGAKNSKVEYAYIENHVKEFPTELIETSKKFVGQGFFDSSKSRYKFDVQNFDKNFEKYLNYNDLNENKVSVEKSEHGVAVIHKCPVASHEKEEGKNFRAALYDYGIKLSCFANGCPLNSKQSQKYKEIHYNIRKIFYVENADYVEQEKSEEKAKIEMSVFSPTLRTICAELARSNVVPEEIALIYLLGLTSSCLRGKAILDFTNRHKTSSNMFLFVSAQSGAGKSPIYDAVFEEFHNRSYMKKMAYAQAYKEYRELKDAGEEVFPPPNEQISLEDVTYEAMVEVLGDSPEGVAFASDEISGVFSEINRFSKNATDIACKGFINSWNYGQKGKMSATRKTNNGINNNVVVERPYISIFGALQKELLRDTFSVKMHNLGLIQRCLFASFDFDKENIRKRITDLDESVIHSIKTVTNMVIDSRFGAFKLSKEADIRLAEYAGDLKERFIDNHNIYRYVTKFDIHACKLAINLHILENILSGQEDFSKAQIIQEETMRKVLSMCDYFFEQSVEVYKYAILQRENGNVLLSEKNIQDKIKMALIILKNFDGPQIVLNEFLLPLFTEQGLTEQYVSKTLKEFHMLAKRKKLDGTVKRAYEITHKTLGCCKLIASSIDVK